MEAGRIEGGHTLPGVGLFYLGVGLNIYMDWLDLVGFLTGSDSMADPETGSQHHAVFLCIAPQYPAFGEVV